MKKEYFKNVDFFRFILITSIIINHLYCCFDVSLLPIYEHIKNTTTYFYTAVDLFFVMAGFFLFYTTDFTEDFYDFVKHKLIRLMPVLLFTLIIFYILTLFTPLKAHKFENLWTIFLLNNVGITLSVGDIGASWFVSSLFWSSCLMFYSYKILKKEKFNLLCALVTFFCYIFLINHEGQEVYYNYCGIFNRGMLRALGSMGLGYFIWNLYEDKLKYLKNYKFNFAFKFPPPPYFRGVFNLVHN